MSRESAAAYKLASNDEVPEFKELPANENYEVPTAANDNFELPEEAPLEIDNDRIDDVRERLGIRTGQAPIETTATNENSNEGIPVLAENPGGATPEGPQSGEGDGGNGDNNGGTTTGGGHVGPPSNDNRVERAKRVLHSQSHGDWMNSFLGKWGVIYPLAYIFMPIWDFLKNTRWGDAFKTKGGGGGGGAPKGGGGHH